MNPPPPTTFPINLRARLRIPSKRGLGIGAAGLLIFLWGLTEPDPVLVVAGSAYLVIVIVTTVVDWRVLVAVSPDSVVLRSASGRKRTHTRATISAIHLAVAVGGRRQRLPMVLVVGHEGVIDQLRTGLIRDVDLHQAFTAAAIPVYGDYQHYFAAADFPSLWPGARIPINPPMRQYKQLVAATIAPMITWPVVLIVLTAASGLTYAPGYALLAATVSAVCAACFAWKCFGRPTTDVRG